MGNVKYQSCDFQIKKSVNVEPKYLKEMCVKALTGKYMRSQCKHFFSFITIFISLNLPLDDLLVWKFMFHRMDNLPFANAL